LVSAKEVAIVSTGAGAVGSKVRPSGGIEDMMVQMKGVELVERADEGTLFESHLRSYLISEIHRKCIESVTLRVQYLSDSYTTLYIF